MGNLKWYLLLGIIGVIGTAYTIYRKKDSYKASTLLVYSLAVACSTWIAEFIVLGLFDSYAYITGVFSDKWAQNLLGHLILNTTLYPASAVILSAFSLGKGWIIVIAGIFTGLEYLFINLKIYEQHWWRYYMTFLAVIAFLIVARIWFDKIKYNLKGRLRIITLYFVAMLIIHLPAPILLLLNKQYYKLDILEKYFGNLYLTSIIITFFYNLIEALWIVLINNKLKKSYWKLAPFIISIMVQIILTNMGILIIEEGWNLIYSLFFYEIFIAIYMFIDKYTLEKN